MQENINYLAPVAEGSVQERSDFIWKVYAHVVGALLALVAKIGRASGRARV